MLGLLLLIFLGPIILFLIISLFFLPFHFAFYSIFNLFTIPWQLIKIAFNKRLRANHALEHATINVIEERLGCLNLAGMGQDDGFIVQGPVDAYLLESAARVGLERLRRGESNLALHRRCGTSMLAANLISSVFIIFLLWTFGYFGIFYILLALITAQLLGPHLGWVMQKYITTSTDVEGMEIVGVERKYENRNFFLGFASLPGRYFIRTRKYNFL
ncbi:MAG: DUF6391 domain-containing protein [Dethiobacteria bacterium]|jgi:hypothetical protein